MHKASTLEFASRPARVGISFVQDPARPLPKRQLTDGMNVILKKGDQRVLVRSIRGNADGSFVGEIYGFEPSFVLDFAGMRLQEHLAFLDSHVFSAG